LQAKAACYQLLAYSLLSHQPVTQPSAADRALRFKRPAQLSFRDPPLFEHDKAKRDAMTVSRLGVAQHLNFAAQGRRDLRGRALR
jgi:hypothetical protein